MKRYALGLFLCYPLLPVAMGCGMGLLQGKLFGLVAILYYLLLLASLWSLRRFGGWVGSWYLLAFAIAWLHLIGVGGMLVGNASQFPMGTQDPLIGLILLTILGVYLAACCAGAALGFRQNRPLQAGLQLFAPLLMCLGGKLGGVPVILAFGGQALHALLLSWRLCAPPELEEVHSGFSPASAE